MGDLLVAVVVILHGVVMGAIAHASCPILFILTIVALMSVPVVDTQRGALDGGTGKDLRNILK